MSPNTASVSASVSAVSSCTERFSVSGMRIATISWNSFVEVFLNVNMVPASTSVGILSKR